MTTNAPARPDGNGRLQLNERFSLVMPISVACVELLVGSIPKAARPAGRAGRIQKGRPLAAVLLYKSIVPRAIRIREATFSRSLQQLLPGSVCNWSGGAVIGGRQV